MSLLDLLLESRADGVILGGELLAHDLGHVLMIVFQLLDLRVQGVLLQLKLLRLLPDHFVPDLALEPVHRLLEEDQQARRAVKLVDQLVALFEELGRDDVLNIPRRVLDAPLHIRDPLVLDVDQVQVVLLLLGEEVAAALELLLAVNDDLSAEVLHCVVEVLHREHNARTRSQCLNLGAPIAQLGEELLHEAQL